MVENRDLLWNPPIRFLYRQRVAEAWPKVRAWDDSTQGKEYMDDLASLLEGYPQQFKAFAEKFPGIVLDNSARGGVLPHAVSHRSFMGAADGVILQTLSRRSFDDAGVLSQALSKRSFQSRKPTTVIES